jgi:hypothetical protein
MDGETYERTGLPKGCQVWMTWHQPRAGPVWELIDRAMTTERFPLQILEISERREEVLRVAEIDSLKSELAQKDSEIATLKQQLREAQDLIPKKRWWAFWRRQ